MIRITVRHSHRRSLCQRDNQEAASDSRQQAHNKRRLTNDDDDEGAEFRSQQRQNTSERANQLSSSIVEIKYSRSRMSTPASARPIKSAPSNQSHEPSKRQLNKAQPSAAATRYKTTAASQQQQQRPRGSLSSCSSSSPDLSGTEETEHYCNYYVSERNGCSSGYSLSVFDESPDELEATAAPVDCSAQATAAQAPLDRAPLPPVAAGRPSAEAAKQARRQHRTNRPLHSRSVSLIVNPEFDRNSSEEEAGGGGSATAKYKRGRAGASSGGGGGGHGDNNGRSFHRRQASQSAVARENFKETDFLRLKQLKDELEARKLLERLQAETSEQLSAEESARLREIGFFLRQVSEEFARNRRLTV